MSLLNTDVIGMTLLGIVGSFIGVCLIIKTAWDCFEFTECTPSERLVGGAFMGVLSLVMLGLFVKVVSSIIAWALGMLL